MHFYGWGGGWIMFLILEKIIKKTNKQTNENINKINKNKAKQSKAKIYNCDVSYFLVYPL